MDFSAYFHTLTRRDYGLLYLSLAQGIEPKFFHVSEDIPLMALCGSRGKSYAIEVMMKSISDRHDPMDTIDGRETRAMFLESMPCDAAYEMLNLHSMHKGKPVTLGFNSSPKYLSGAKTYRLSDGSEARRKVIQHNIDNLFSTFNKHASQNSKTPHGGMIFASQLIPDKAEQTWISVKFPGSDRLGWDKVSAINIGSDKLQNSERFRENWNVMLKQSISHEEVRQRVEQRLAQSRRGYEYDM